MSQTVKPRQGGSRTHKPAKSQKPKAEQEVSDVQADTPRNSTGED